MKGLYSAIIILFTSLLFIQCQREVSFTGGGQTENPNPDPITSHVHGIILDEFDQPAAGVDIKVGNKVAITDSRGYFRINNAQLDKKAALVSASRAGYFDAYRSFGATSGTNHVIIKLIPKTLAGTVNATSGGEVSLPSGAKVKLPANGIVTLTGGNAFTGTVNVYASYIDPTDSDIGQTVPGSFMANDANNNRVQMASYGMMAVLLESSTGEKLQLKSGSKATLTTPIPSLILSSAPNSIPLWYLDEDSGIWEEEGSAVKNGSAYVGEVSHFSFWNCDINVPAITLSLTLKNNDNFPIVHASVRIVRTSSPNAGSAHGFTDSLGQVSGLVPANENLILQVLDDCGNQIYAQNIGPFSQATNLGVITLTNLGSSAITFKGKLLNCSGAPVSNGYAIIYHAPTVRYAATDANGNFSIAYTYCATSAGTASIIGVDAGAMQQGVSTNVNVTTPITDAGNISACGTSAVQYFNYTLDGTTYTISNPASDSLVAFTQLGTSGYTTFLSGSINSSQTGYIDLRFSHMTIAAGNYPVIDLQVNNFPNTTIIAPFNVNVTNLPAIVGQFYEGSFSGQFKDAANVTHNLSGDFRIRKNF